MSIRLTPLTSRPISCFRVHSQVTFYDPSLHPLFAKHCRLQQRCVDIACNNNVQDLNKLKPRLCLDSFHLPMAIHVCLLEVISVESHHYLNAFEPVISTFYIVGCLHRLVITSGTSPELQPDQHLLSLRFHPIHLSLTAIK